MGSTTTSVYVPPSKQKERFLRDIKVLKAPKKSTEVARPPTDAMEKLFGETLVYAKSKEGDLGMPLSDLQKETMQTFLQPLGDQNKYRLRADLKQLPIAEGAKHYFATPSINSGVAEYLSVLSQKSDKPRDKHPLPPGPTRNLDKELERMDGCARAGLKFAIYVQWLISSIKHQLLNALEEDDSLRDPKGDLMQTLDEGFMPV